MFLALDATTLGNRWTVLALGVVVYQHTIPVAWKVVRGNPKGAWLPLRETLLQLLRGALPKAIPVCADPSGLVVGAVDSENLCLCLGGEAE